MMKMPALLSAISATGGANSNEVLKHGFFDRIVDHVSGSYLFQKYVSTWAPPFDNASFDAAVLCILIGMAVWTIYGACMNSFYHRKARERMAGIRAEREAYLAALNDQKAADREEENPESIDEIEKDVEAMEQESVVEDYPVYSEEKQEENSDCNEEHKAIVDAKKAAAVGDGVSEDNYETTDDVVKNDVGRLVDAEANNEYEKDLPDEGVAAFNNLIENLRSRQRQEARAMEIERETKEATRHNLELLKNDMENAIAENRAVSEMQQSKEADFSALSNAQQKAIKAREKERLKMEKSVKKCG